MAEKKALFRIEINGITESCNVVKDLNAQLKELKKQVKGLENTKIKVAVETQAPKTTVQGNDSPKQSQQAQQTSALAKLQEQLAKAQVKAQAQVTDEYKVQYQELVKVNEASKEAEKTQKQIAQGVRDTNGEYANTLSGLRAYLSDLQKTFNQQEIGTDSWKETQAELNRVRELVKGIEQSTGDFRRNVGNYPSGAKDLVVLFQQTKDQIEEARKELTDLNSQLSNTQSGTQQYDRLQTRIDELTQSMSEAEAQAEDLNQELSKKIEVNIGGNVQYFDDLNQAAEELEKRLRGLAYEGKTDTEEFEQTIQTLGRMRTAMANVTGEVDSYIGNSKGLRDTVEIMQGLTSLTSLSTGLQGLFGIDNEQLDKSLKTFTQITLIMNGLSEIQKQINDKTSIWGTNLNKIWQGLQSISGKMTFFDKAQTMEQNVKVTVDYQQTKDQIAKLTDEITPIFEEMSSVVGESMKGVFDASVSAISQAAQGGEENVRTALENMVTATSDAAGKMEQRLQSLSLTPDADPTEINALQQSLGELNNDYVNLQQTLTDFNNGTIDQEEVLKRLQEQFTGLTKSMDGGDGKIEALGEQLSDLSQSEGGLAAQTQEVQGTMGGFSKALASMGPMGKVAAAGIRTLSGAIRSLMSATIILAVVQALMMAIEGLIDGLKSLSGQDTAKAVEDFDALGASIQNSKDKMEQFNKEVDRAKQTGEINELEANRRKLEEVSAVAEKAATDLKKYISTLEDVKPIEFGDDKDWEDAWFASRHIKDLDEFKKRYEQLVQAVSQGVDESKVVTGSGATFLTASDAATNLANMQKAALQELEYKINQIDFSKGEAAFKEFINLTNDELYSSALANIDKLFPEDQWQQGLKTRIDAYRDFAQQMYDINTQMASSSAQLERTIEDNLAAAISDPYQRGVKQRQLARDRELKEVEGNARAEESVRKKYATMDRDARRAHNKQVNAEAKAARQRKLQIENDAMQAEINLMGEGLAKQRSQLRLQQKQALASARENGASKATLLKIKQHYDRLILDEENDFTRQLFLAQRERQNIISDEYYNYAETLEDWANTVKKQHNDFLKYELEANQKQQEALIGSINKKKLTFDVNPSSLFHSANINYQMMLASQKHYLEESKKIDQEAARQEFEEQQQNLERQQRARERYYSDWFTQQNDATMSRLKQGLITQDEYDQQMAENQRIVNEHWVDESQWFFKLEESLEEQHNQRMGEIDLEYQRRTNSLLSEYYTKRRENIIAYYQGIQDVQQRHSKQNRNSLGIINYQKEKANLRFTKEEYNRVLKEIEAEYELLKEQLENHEITFDDFSKAKQELDRLRNSVKDSVADVDTSLKNLIMDTVKSVTDVASQYVQAFSEIWSMISSLKDVELDQQEKRLEREQELLDEELEMLEKQYQKQQELTQKHADKINDIEGELSGARGDRRDFLLDQLARERDAELKSLETENQIQQEKEKNEKKQQQLEKQKEALEKKRWEQNKKNQIVQATINTYTAVTNALAVQPWFVGLALSAVALALGMANVAKIQAQKYYADGGLLSGKSHAQGGIPVGQTGIEVEGGEYIINKRTTKYNQSLLEYVNSQRRPLTRDDLSAFFDNGKTSLVPRSLKSKYADGGNLPKIDTAAVEDVINNNSNTEEKEVVVSVVDIINRMENIQRVRVLAGLG